MSALPADDDVGGLRPRETDQRRSFRMRLAETSEQIGDRRGIRQDARLTKKLVGVAGFDGNQSQYSIHPFRRDCAACRRRHTRRR